MKQANEFGHEILQVLRDAGMQVRVVNDKVDEDSVVEHVIDYDVTYQGVDYNILMTVIRIGKTLRLG